MTATVNITCAKDGTVLASNVVTDAYTCPKDVVAPPPSFLDVKSRGAKGDGSADDTAVLASAAAEAASKGLRLYSGVTIERADNRYE